MVKTAAEADRARVPDDATRMRAPAHRPLTVLKGVGPRIAARFAQRNIHGCDDLLWLLPVRYQDRTHVTPLADVVAGAEAVIEGIVVRSAVRFGGRRTLEVTVEDGSAALTLRFFHFTAAQQAAFAQGVSVRCYGVVRRSKHAWEMVHPEYRLLTAGEDVVPAAGLTPVYPAIGGIGPALLRSLIRQALATTPDDSDGSVYIDNVSAGAGEAVAAALRDFPSLLDAARYLHAPPADVDVALLNSGRHPAQRRLAFDELLAHYLGLRQARVQYQTRAAPPCNGDGALSRRFLQQLTFALTAAQQRAIAEIARDLDTSRPMQRLLQGDVGCGKTVIAAAAIAHVIAAGYQVALMAPTELLAEQHGNNLRDWFAPLGVPVLALTGSTPAATRRAIAQRLASREPLIIVGTHALYQQDIAFGDIGLVIIDEQHRFGVHQRLALRDKGKGGRLPHQLIMTATPIPRTLAMTIYADLDVSTVDDLPPGRRPVTTVVVPDARRSEIYARVGALCAERRQAYWVCTLIDASEAMQCQDATRAAQEIAAALPQLRVGLLHGRLRPAEKDAVMRAFKQGSIDVLVATTVIEVGVDVPNATLMVIENAERLGLAQLHQLRGRVGRGAQASHCVLMYGGRLSRSARARLAILRKSNDGFAIAAEDMRLRGPGEVLGVRQAGTLEFRIADLLRDQDMFALVRATGEHILARQPDVADAIVRRWVGALSDLTFNV